jgi:hypothetical protein
MLEGWSCWEDIFRLQYFWPHWTSSFLLLPQETTGASHPCFGCRFIALYHFFYVRWSTNLVDPLGSQSREGLIGLPLTHSPGVGPECIRGFKKSLAYR